MTWEETWYVDGAQSYGSADSQLWCRALSQHRVLQGLIQTGVKGKWGKEGHIYSNRRKIDFGWWVHNGIQL